GVEPGSAAPDFQWQRGGGRRTASVCAGDQYRRRFADAFGIDEHALAVRVDCGGRRAGGGTGGGAEARSLSGPGVGDGEPGLYREPASVHRRGFVGCGVADGAASATSADEIALLAVDSHKVATINGLA